MARGSLLGEQACRALEQHNVPHAPVRDAVEVTHDRHLHERKFLEWIDHPQYGRVAIADSPLRLHGADRLPAVASARLGADTEEIMTTVLGASPEEFRQWTEDGAFGPAASG